MNNMNDNNKFSVEGNSRRIQQSGQDGSVKRPSTSPSDDKTFRNIYEDDEGESGEDKVAAFDGKGENVSSHKTQGQRTPFQLSAESKDVPADKATETAMATDSQQQVAAPQVAQPQQHPGQVPPNYNRNGGGSDKGSSQGGSKEQESFGVKASADGLVADRSQAKNLGAAFLTDKAHGSQQELPSLFDVAAKSRPQIQLDKDGALAAAAEGVVPTVDKKKIDTADMRFTRDAIDIATVNPNAAAPNQAQSIFSVSAAERAQPVVRVNLQEIYNQLVGKLDEIRNSGKTEMVITLNAATGVFKDARVVVTNFDTARGDLNIAFENLNPGAQRLLDMQNHRAHLMENLEKSGYHVQMFVATSYNEPRTTVANANLQSDDQERRERGDDNPDGKQQKRQNQG